MLVSYFIHSKLVESTKEKLYNQAPSKNKT